MDIRQLIDSVQLNCHISDARHAGNYTLCVYLLKMREFYRWEKQQTYSKKLSSDDIGAWLSKREQLWEEVEAEDYHQDYYQKNPVRYNYYRYICGRDQRLEELWGTK